MHLLIGISTRQLDNPDVVKSFFSTPAKRRPLIRVTSESMQVCFSEKAASRVCIVKKQLYIVSM
jgi:hypothetical protein